MSPRDLYTAVTYQNQAAVEKIIRKLQAKSHHGIAKSRKLYYRDENGLTALHKAALTGQYEVLKLLLTFNLDLNLSDVTGHTALHYAAYSGIDASIYLLAKYGANINAQDDEGQTSLHIASRDGHAHVCTALLKCGAQLLIRDKSGKTAIETAAESGKDQVLKICLQNPDSKNILNGRQKRFGEDEISRSGSITRKSISANDEFANLSPLQLAILNGHADCIQTLIQFGCDINQENSSGTALHDAALSGKLKIVQLLVQNGADVFKTNQKGETPLDKLNKYVSHGGCADVKQYLHECMTSLKARVIKKYDIIPNSSHLILSVGDIVTILEQNPSGIWKGVINKRSGYFPKECVEIMPRSLGNPKRKPSISESTKRVQPERHSNPQSLMGTNYITVDVSSLEEQKRISSDWMHESFGSSKKFPNVPSSLDFERFKMPMKTANSQSSKIDQNQQHAEFSNGDVSHYDKASDSCEILNEEANKILYSLSHHSAFSKANEIEALERLFQEADLKKFARVFIECGYDSYTAVRMSSADLAAVGVTNPNQRRRIVEIFQVFGNHIPAPRQFHEAPETVSQFLEGINLSQYTDLFVKSEFISLEELSKATMEDLMEIGIDKQGHQKRILIYLKMVFSSLRKEPDFNSDFMSMSTDMFLDSLSPSNQYASIDLESPSYDSFDSPVNEIQSQFEPITESNNLSKGISVERNDRFDVEDDSGNYTMEEDNNNSPDTINGSTETLTSNDQIHISPPQTTSPQSSGISPSCVNKFQPLHLSVQSTEDMRNSPDIFSKISVYPGHSLKRTGAPKIPHQGGVHLSIDPVTKQPYLVTQGPGQRLSQHHGVPPNRDNKTLFTHRQDSFIPPSLPSLRNNQSTPLKFTASRNVPEMEQKNGGFKPPEKMNLNSASFNEAMKGMKITRTESVGSLESEDPYVQIPPPPPLRLKTPPSDAPYLFNLAKKDLNGQISSFTPQQQS